MASEEAHVTRNFQNIYLHYQGVYYEQEQILMLISILTAKLCNELNYKDSLFLNFSPPCQRNNPSNYYYIFYKDSCLKERHLNSDYEDSGSTYFDKDILIIEQVASSFDPLKTLKLVEYGIKNREFIYQNRKKICNDTNILNKIFNEQPSEAINKIIEEKTYRKDFVFDFDSSGRIINSNENENLTYYYQNNLYYIQLHGYCFGIQNNSDTNKYSSKGRYKDTNALILSNIYQFKKIDFDKLIIFDTDSTFYYLKYDICYYIHKSKKHTIIKESNSNDASYFHYVNEINYLDGDLVSIYFSEEKIFEQGFPRYNFTSSYIKYRHALYFIDEDRLVQNLEKELESILKKEKNK